MANPSDSSSPFSPYRADGKLYGFVCIVTGATQPIGKAIVAELATHGAACVYACHPSTDQSPPPAVVCHNSAQESDVPATRIIPYPLDPSSEADALAILDEVLNAWGRLDIWVCSSGLLGPASIGQTTPEDLQRVWQTNSLAPFFALKYAPPAMGKKCEKRNYANASEKDRAYGSIIVVGSVASESGGCWGPCYTMSAHAALGVVRAGVAVLRGTGVRINCISPGQIDSGTDLTRLDANSMKLQLPPAGLMSEEFRQEHVGLGRPGYPTEVARVAGFLASGFSSYMTGTNMVVDGGASAMCPLTGPV